MKNFLMNAIRMTPMMSTNPMMVANRTLVVPPADFLSTTQKSFTSDTFRPLPQHKM